jgi:tRNA(adenine34) deaminase
MQLALQEAELAKSADEVPIGAVLVKDEQLIAKTHNQTNESRNALQHAEKLVIEKALQQGEKYLYDYTLYVTVEPCLMCAGMIILARVGRLVFGCYDPKAGAVGSIYNVLLDKSFNHHPKITQGVLAEESSAIITEFFRTKKNFTNMQR